jgi:hypothetical protein
MLTGKRLEAYLAWVIHGRRTPLRAMSSMRRGPPRNEAYKDWIRSLPCVACGVEGRSEAAHTGGDGGMSMKASDYSCVPLCADCHRQAPGVYHRLGKCAFVRARGVRFEEMTARLQKEWRRKCA